MSTRISPWLVSQPNSFYFLGTMVNKTFLTIIRGTIVNNPKQKRKMYFPVYIKQQRIYQWQILVAVMQECHLSEKEWKHIYILTKRRMHLSEIYCQQQRFSSFSQAANIIPSLSTMYPVVSMSSRGWPTLYWSNFSSGFSVTPSSAHRNLSFWLLYETVK